MDLFAAPEGRVPAGLPCYWKGGCEMKTEIGSRSGVTDEDFFAWERDMAQAIALRSRQPQFSWPSYVGGVVSTLVAEAAVLLQLMV